MRTALRETRDGGKLATFAQTIGGIPVDSVNEILVDKAGKFLQLSTTVIPSGLEPVKPLISQRSAIARVQVEWEAQFSKRTPEIDIESPVSPRYRLAKSADGLELYYGFFFTVADELDEYFARIDAISGRAEILTTTRHIDFWSCKDIGIVVGQPPQPPASGCFSQGTLKGYAIPTQAGFCSNPNGATGACAFVDMKNSYEVVTDTQAAIGAAAATGPAGIPPACCTQMNGTHIILGSRVTGHTSSFATGTSKIFMLPAESNSAEIMAHEMGHLYHRIYNSSAELAGDPSTFSNAVQEGGADVFSALIGQISGRTARYGTKWTHGDGQGIPSGYTGNRSASNPAFQYWQDVTVAAGGHASGQVISRFFRRLQETTGISDQRLLGILMGMWSTIRDEDSPRNGIDAGDFRRAVLRAVKSDETALKNAVTTLYTELYRADAQGPSGPPLPPGDPGPAGAPPITPSIVGAFAFCGTVTGTAVSVYQTSWTATPNTDRYQGWVKADAEPAFRFSIEVPSSVTSALLYTNVPAEGRVTSCNVFGCSGLSLSRVFVTQQPPCNF